MMGQHRRVHAGKSKWMDVDSQAIHYGAPAENAAEQGLQRDINPQFPTTSGGMWVYTSLAQTWQMPVIVQKRETSDIAGLAASVSFPTFATLLVDKTCPPVGWPNIFHCLLSTMSQFSASLLRYRERQAPYLIARYSGLTRQLPNHSRRRSQSQLQVRLDDSRICRTAGNIGHTIARAMTTTAWLFLNA